MSGLTVSSKTTPYSTGGTNGTSSSTTVSRSSSSTTISNKVSSTTPNTTGVTASTTTVTKTTGAVTSSTTTAYGASNTNSVVRFISSSTTVSKNVSSTTPSVSSSTTVRSNVSSTTPSVSSGTPKVEGLIDVNVENLVKQRLEIMTGLKDISIEDVNPDTLKELWDNPSTSGIENTFETLNRKLYSDVLDKLNKVINGSVQFTNEFNLFNIEYNIGIASFKYYGNLSKTNGEGSIDIKAEQALNDMMNNSFDIKGLTTSIGTKNVSSEIADGELWLQFSDEDENFKINMMKLAGNILDVAYERTAPLQRSENESIDMTIGFELEMGINVKDAKELELAYEYAYSYATEKESNMWGENIGLGEIKVRTINENITFSDDLKKFSLSLIAVPLLIFGTAYELTSPSYSTNGIMPTILPSNQASRTSVKG